MKPKNQSGFSVILIIGIVAVLAASGFYFFVRTKPANTIPENEIQEDNTKDELSVSIKSLLEQKIKNLESFTAEAEFVSLVEQSQSKNANLSMAEIQQLDKKWQSEGENDSFVNGFMTNSIAASLFRFQEDNPGFVELFVTDAKGLNIGQTNKTSDYYQADEDWWTGAYNNGSGRAYFGKIEYDESAKSESISLYVPIYGNQKVVSGILKAVLSLTAIKTEV